MSGPAAPASHDALLVFAKQPEPGSVKTRMCPPLSFEEAARLYAAMLEDILEATASFASALNLQAVLCLDSPKGEKGLPFPTPDSFVVEAQKGRGLAARMESAVEAAFQRGARRVLVRGTDTPTLSQEHLEQALEALEDHEVVFSPDRDGGYGVVGFSSFRPGLLDLPMSTETVFVETQARAQAWGFRTACVVPCFDLDGWSDLSDLRRVRGAPSARLCPRTLAFLDAEKCWSKA